MSLLQASRPVIKSGSRLLLASSHAAVDHPGSLTEVPAPPAPNQIFSPTLTYSDPPASPARQPAASSPAVPALWQIGGSSSSRWPGAVESWLAQGRPENPEAESQLVQGGVQQNLQVQPIQYQVGSADASQSAATPCVFQVGFPAGACGVWPAFFLTTEGCFSQGFPIAGFVPLEQQPQQPQVQQMQAPLQEVAASASSTARAALGRTGASRKQRRRLKAAGATEGQAPASAEQVQASNASPAPPGRVARPVPGQAPGNAPLVPGPLVIEQSSETSGASHAVMETSSLASTDDTPTQGQYWGPTPESTPPNSPRVTQQALVNFNAMLANVWEAEAGRAFHGEKAELVVESVTEGVPDEEMIACEQLMAQLEDAEQRPAVIEMLSTSAWSMACTPGGTRVVQKALEVAETSERIAMAQLLKGHVKEAFASPHANHVLQKCIELIPPDRIQFVLAEMHGHAVAAARHRYGCRVLERLLEHCPTEQTAPLVDEVLAGTAQLCRHTFGNFVVQHVLEHGTSAQRHVIAESIHADIQRLARHRVASHVVRCALKHTAPEDRNMLVQAIRADAAELADLAHHHCGSFVVREMRRADGLRR